MNKSTECNNANKCFDLYLITTIVGSYGDVEIHSWNLFVEDGEDFFKAVAKFFDREVVEVQGSTFKLAGEDAPFTRTLTGRVEDCIAANTFSVSDNLHNPDSTVPVYW